MNPAENLSPTSASTGDVPPIRVGIGGWTYAPWRNSFYPDDLVQRRELEYASRQLRAIEINGTFYRAQKPAIYAKWAAETPPGFMFSVKAPRYLTHRKKLADAGDGVRRFIDGGLAEMGDRLGPILWQLPASHPFEEGDLSAFLDLLPRVLNGETLRHALEVRHPDFAEERFVEIMRRHRVAIVFTDSPDNSSLADLTGDLVYARLKASVDDEASGYAPGALKRWSAHCRQWAAGDDPADLPHVAAPLAKAAPREVWAFFIGAAKQRNPAAALALQRRVDAGD